MKLKERLMSELSLKPNEFKALCDRVQVEIKAEYSPEEESLLTNAATRPQVVDRPIKKGGLAKTQAPVNGGIQQTQHIVQARHNRGAALGAKAAIAELEGFTQAYTGITDAFYGKFAQLTNAQSVEAESFDAEAVEVNVDDFLSPFFDAEAIAALPASTNS